MRQGDFHSTYPVWVGGEIRTGYTCNVLLRMSAQSVAGRRFSLARGSTGGEDTQFFDEVSRAGGAISYAPEAWVEEAVPPGRASFAWLARRRFRAGQTHGHLLRGRYRGLSLAAQVALASSKVAYCLAGVLPTVASPVARNCTLLRGIMHAGAVSGLIGLSELRLYGNAPARESPRHAA
jgi:succinoglycan biosynthesis protein ExoM